MEESDFHELIQKVLSTLPIAEAINPSELSTLFSQAKTHRLKDGEQLTCSSRRDSSVYLLLDGSVEIYIYREVEQKSRFLRKIHTRRMGW